MRSIEAKTTRVSALGANTERFDVIVIGGGQAGLSVGYYLARRGQRFVILDASERIGDSWRNRWDSLRLFSPARFDGLDGMPFPAPPDSFPTKDEMADYLEAYAKRFGLPVRSGVRVDSLSRRDERDGGRGYIVKSGDRTFEADQVVVAMAGYQQGRVPEFARELSREIVQLHSSEYRNPSQLRKGGVLLAGAGNSGSEIALEVARCGHETSMAGTDTGQVPFRMNSFWGRLILARLVFRFLFHRILTIRTPMGRKARPKILAKGAPLIRVREADLVRANVARLPRIARVENGLPVLEDGRTLDVANVIWCTGYHAGFSWIDLPIFGNDGGILHEGGVVPSEPGLYFVGLAFLYAMSSSMIHGVGRDAARLVDTLAKRQPRRAADPSPQRLREPSPLYSRSG
jgi:putative flavoprotein involved in K+ transport